MLFNDDWDKKYPTTKQNTTIKRSSVVADIGKSIAISLFLHGIYFLIWFLATSTLEAIS